MGVNTDTVFSHIAFQKNLGGLSFPLVTDRWPYAMVAQSYRLFPPSRHTIPFVNDRAVVIVDKNGRIAWQRIYELREKPDVTEILDALSRLA